MAGTCSPRDNKYSNADVKHISKVEGPVGLERDTEGVLLPVWTTRYYSGKQNA